MIRWTTLRGFAMMLLISFAWLSHAPAVEVDMVDDGRAAAPMERPFDRIAPVERGMLIEATELLASGQFDEAETILRNLLATSPGLDEAQLLLVTVLIQSGKNAETRAAFEKYYANLRGRFGFLNNYAWFLATASDVSFRDPARALELAQQAMLLAPDVFQIWSTLAEAHFVSGNFERAARTMAQTLEMASRAGAEPERIESYRASLRKMMEANAVMSLIE